MAFERITDNLRKLNESIRAFTESSAAYYKLNLFNISMKGATAAVKYFMVIFFVLFALLFLSIAVSLVLSVWLEAPSSGFFIVGGFYLLVGILVLFFGKPAINRIILSKTSKKVFQQSKEQPAKAHPEYARGVKYEKEEVIVEEDERV